MKIWLNGKFVEEEEAKVDITSGGFLYGQGVFETMRAYNERVFRLDSHLERLFKALPVLNLELAVGPEVLKKAVKQALKENNLKDAYLRITVWQGKDRPEAAVFAKAHNFLTKEDYCKGFKAILSTFCQNEFSILSGIKSANYLPLLLAYQEAKKKTADEAILLNTRDFLAEASRANIFLVKDNCLLTPSLDCGCLPGITRDTVLGLAAKERIKVIETKLKPEDIQRADEAFLTNSLIEIMPLTTFEGRPVKKGFPGKITELILKRYRLLLQ